MEDATESAVRDAIAAALAESPLKAGGFIVTLYGDVVVPRGGVVWIGNLIETCAAVGINESLVRTAVSRLVAAGRLAAARAGRRGFYRLTAAARAELAGAAAILYSAAPEPETDDWRFSYLPPGAEIAALERAGHARLAPRLAVAPWREGEAPGGLVFRARVAAGAERLRAFAAAHWDLAERAAAHAGFVRRFRPLAALIEGGARPPGATCLIARLVLVHQFRAVALGDPRLPAAALPPDWPGGPARRLFATIYLALSEAADAHVAAAFVAPAGPLEVEGDAVARRLAALAA